MNPSELGDYIAIAGVKGDGYVRIFIEADESDPRLPAFVATKDPLPSNEEPTVGDTVTFDDAVLSITDAVRLSNEWQIFDPEDEDTIFWSSPDASITIPDTSAAGDGERVLRIKAVYEDPYTTPRRAITVYSDIVLPGVGGRPRFTTAPTLTGGTTTGSVLTVGTAVATGDPAPAITYAPVINGVEGTYGAKANITAATAGTYEVRAKAVNSKGEATSTSNAIIVTSPSTPAPTWNDAWFSFEELQVAPAGRLSVTVGGTGFALNSLFDYYIYTSNLASNTISDVRKNGQIFTAAGTFIRPAKALGTVVEPRIVAILKTAAAEGSDEGLFVLQNKGQYTVTGILSLTDAATQLSTSYPAPSATSLSEAKAEYAAAGQYVCRFNASVSGTSDAYAAHRLAIIALGAYYGDAGSITLATSQLKYWFNNELGNSFSSADVATDPLMMGGYPSNFHLMEMCMLAVGLFSPDVKAGLTANEQKAIGCYFEWAVVGWMHLLGAQSNGDSIGYNLRGDKGAIRKGEPNISAGNHFILAIGRHFFRTPEGKRHLTNRGFTSFSDMLSKWARSGFLTYMDGLKASGKRLTENLYQTVNFANRGWTKSPYSSANAPSNSALSTQLNKGANWKVAVSGHTVDDTAGMALHYLFRCFGKDAGTSINLGTERTGTVGKLGDPANPNDASDPPTGNGGPRVCHRGIRWFRGFAVGATINQVTSLGGQIENKQVASGTKGTAPDNKLGFPIYLNSRGTTHAQRWNISNGAFLDRRGVPMAETYPFPFIGETGALSEMNTFDAGSYVSATQKGTGGMRCALLYSTETSQSVTGVLALLAMIGQGPNNMHVNPGMGAGWSSTDANWAKITATASHAFRSSSVYRHPYTAGQTGVSGELIDAGLAVTPGQAYVITAQSRMESGGGNITVKARFKNASGATVGTDTTVFSGNVSTYTKDYDKEVTAPTGAATMHIVVTVNKASTTGPVLFGGPNIRYVPYDGIDWQSDKAKELAERARRGLIYFRACWTNGWKSGAKMAYNYVDVNPSNVGNVRWADSQGETWRIACLISNFIESVIPWWRKNIDGYPAYGAGYTGRDWEAPVDQSRADKGAVAK